MGLKHHTIIFVPHTRARFRKWRVTNLQMGLLASLAVLLLSASLFTSWSFLTNTIDGQELARLARENEELQRVNQSFETSARDLRKRLSDFEERTRQLAIVAGIESLSPEQETGIGGDDPLPAPGDPLSELLELEGRVESLTGDLDLVGRSLDERLRLISSTPAIAPVKGILTSSYGYRRDPLTGQRALHRAIDISTAPGHPVKATADGIVIRANRSGRLGRAVHISHGYGITTIYGHLSRAEASPGQLVERGEVIGFVGNTGRATGYHLHYEVRVDGKLVNPLAYILDGTSVGS